MICCKKILFKGNVQGVGFRYFAYSKAIELGLKGYVKNMFDGSVEMIAEREPEKMERLIKICVAEHPYANVDNYEVEELVLQNFESFKIIR